MVSLWSVTMQPVVSLPRVSHQSSRVEAEDQQELDLLVFLFNGAVMVSRNVLIGVMSLIAPNAVQVFFKLLETKTKIDMFLFRSVPVSVGSVCF